MVLPVSGPISISDVAGEFGGVAPHSLSEYYRLGGLVPDLAINAGIPTSGAISLSDFYGTASTAVENYTVTYAASGPIAGDGVTLFYFGYTRNIQIVPAPPDLGSITLNNTFNGETIRGIYDISVNVSRIRNIEFTGFHLGTPPFTSFVFDGTTYTPAGAVAPGGFFTGSTTLWQWNIPSTAPVGSYAATLTLIP